MHRITHVWDCCYHNHQQSLCSQTALLMSYNHTLLLSAELREPWFTASGAEGEQDASEKILFLFYVELTLTWERDQQWGLTAKRTLFFPHLS